LSLRIEAGIRALTALPERLGAAADVRLASSAEWLADCAERLGGSAERLTGAEAADRKPLESLPVESLPVESLPVESLPVESLPLESLPLESLALDCLHGQLLHELLNRNANLLDDGTLHCDLLRELAQHRDDLVCRYVDPCVAGKRAREERIRREGLLVAELGVAELVAELRVAVVHAGLSKRSGAHLRKPALRSWKLGSQALRRIL
jgi:hypothetical protein